ncbi:hypothetical protein CWO28_01435 [Vibrio splendidus]|nr:hypothetical protein CWO28_01435 [Vibrio splendidus]
MVACGNNERFNSGFDIGVILQFVMYIFIEVTDAIARFGTKATQAFVLEQLDIGPTFSVLLKCGFINLKA